MPSADFIRQALADMVRNDAAMAKYMEKFERAIRPYNVDAAGLDPVQITNVLLARDQRRDIKHWWGNTESYAMLTQTRALEIIAVWAADQLLRQEDRSSTRLEEVQGEGRIPTRRR